jgi:crotonobetainyl-CoA:carnitine CoA-transferase CaiB-like acyl-CoA transferase
MDTVKTAPLEGIRVVELGGGVPAGYCTHLLAGYGAHVVQVGDPGLTDDEDRYLSRGKQRVVAPDAHAVADLVAAANVVVDGRSPRGRDSLGGRGDALPSAPELHERHAHLVITALTPFGLDGPHAHHRATNIVSFASGGIMALTGEPERPPLQTGGEQALMLGGLHGFAATTTALLGALVQGEGDLIDISLQECAASMLEYCAAAWEYDSLFVERSGNTPRAEWGVYPAADGWAGVCCLGRQLPALLDQLGLEHEPRFLDPVQRMEHRDELMAHVLVFMVERTKDELVALGPASKLPIGAVRTPAELVAHGPLIERGFFDDGPDGRLPGRPFPGLDWVHLQPVTEASADDVLASWRGALAGEVAS